MLHRVFTTLTFAAGLLAATALAQEGGDSKKQDEPKKPAQWKGHTVAFHEPIAWFEEEEAEEAKRRAKGELRPPPSDRQDPRELTRVTLAENGDLKFGDTACGNVKQGGLKKLHDVLTAAVKEGKRRPLLAPDYHANVHDIVRVMAVCQATGGAPLLQAVNGTVPEELAKGEVKDTDRVTPPTAKHGVARVHDAAKTAVIELDAKGNRIIWQGPDGTREAVDDWGLLERLKKLHGAHPEPGYKSYSSATVLVVIGEGVSWGWAGQVLMWCRSEMFWRIEAVVQPPEKADEATKKQ